MDSVFTFSGQNQIAQIKISNGELYISTERTRYRFWPFKIFYTFRDKEMVDFVYKKFRNSSKEEFRAYLVDEFKKMGYELKSFKETG